jgi:hypothetical protein
LYVFDSPPSLLSKGGFGNHCVPSILFASFRLAKDQSHAVVLGAHSLSKNEPSKQTFEIKKFIPFSRLLPDSRLDDIMLIKVCSIAFIFSNMVQLVKSTA